MGDSLARRLQDATDPTSAAEALAESLLESDGVEAVRVWLAGPGDRCDTCLSARECDGARRDRCFHLTAELGAFARGTGLVERLPREDASPDAGPIAPERLGGPVEEGTLHAAPLAAAGRRIGHVALRIGRALEAAEKTRVDEAAMLAAATLRHLLLEDREDRRRHQIGLLNDLARKVGTILNDELLLRQAVGDVRRTFGFPDVMIFLRDEHGEHYTLRARSSAAQGSSLVGRGVRQDQGIVGRTARTGETTVVSDVTTDPDFVSWSPESRSEIAVPIIMQDCVEGVLNVESDELDAFGPTEQLVLETVANQLAIALENARLFSMVRGREDRYRALIEGNPGAVMHLDAEGRIVFQNPAARGLTGRAEDDPATGPVTLAGVVGREDGALVEAAFSRALAGDARELVKLRLKHVDGTPRWVEASFLPFMDDDGEHAGVLLLARDLSREKELQQKLYQAEKLGAIGGLVSGVAHELNNPLTGILGFAQLLLAGTVETWSREDLEKIEHNARRCQAIVESLLQFARQTRIRKRPASLNDVIESVLKLNEYSLRADGVRIEKHYDPRLPPIDLDLNRWQQVIINLASNAQQAILSKDGSEKRIRFETHLEGGEAVLTVEDTGPGVPSAVRGRVFDPFFTTKETGTGLGLSICYGIIQDHGGTIELDSAYEGGTRFVIRLPLAPEAEERPAPVSVSTRALPRTTGGRVLVLEDEPAVRDVIAAWLERYGFGVECCERGEEALRRARQSPPDVLLVDVALPGEMDGLAFYDALSGDAPSLSERVIFVTGYASHQGLARDIGRRGAPCLQKPFDLNDLLNQVRRMAAKTGGAERIRG